MGIWGVVQIIGVAWFAASVVIAIAWALVGRRIFRPRPVQPRIVRKDGQPMTKAEADGVRMIIEADLEARRHGGER